MNKTEHYAKITPRSGGLGINFAELWRYKDLVFLFTRKTFVLIYKQTVLGPAWIVLQPLFTTLIYTVVFGNIAQMSTDGIPQILFYMGGSALWSFFATALTQTANTFTSNAAIFGKVYFPRLVMPVSHICSSAINFGVQFVMFLCFWAYFLIRGEIAPNFIAIIALPLLLVYLGLLALGCGLIISSLTAKYRDLALVVGFGVQLWMYITPVVYPASSLGNGILRSLIMFNPVSPAVEAFRYIFLGTGQIDVVAWLVGIAVMLVLVLFGSFLFNRTEKTFMDTV